MKEKRREFVKMQLTPSEPMLEGGKREEKNYFFGDRPVWTVLSRS